MRKFLGLAAIAAMLCCGSIGCHTRNPAFGLPVVKGITFTGISESDCRLTVKALVKLGTRNGQFVDSFFDIFLGTDGMAMDDLLANPGSPTGSITVAAGDVNGDGTFEATLIVDLSPGHHPVALRARFGHGLSAMFPVGVFAGSVPAGLADLNCRVVGTDVLVAWSNLGAANSITLILRPGEGEVRQVLDGSATSAEFAGALAASVGETIRGFATNCYGNSESVSCTVARPGTPSLGCVLDGDNVVVSWSSEALSVEVFENGTSLGVQSSNGSLSLCDRNPGTYCYTAIGTGLEDQPDSVSDTAKCVLHRKSRLLLTNRCDDGEVARVLLDGEKDPPVLVNAKVLTLSFGDVSSSDGLSFDNFRTSGSCASLDSFFDITYIVDFAGQTVEGTYTQIDATVNGQPVDVHQSEGTGRICRIDTCDAGTVQVVITMSDTVQIETNDGVQTEPVSLTLTGSVVLNQTETPLFGTGSEDLCIPSAEYADAFIDNQSNVGNRVVLVPEYVEAHGQGYGFGIGHAQGYTDIDLDVTGCAWYSDYIKLYGGGTGTFFDNNLPNILGHQFGNTDSVFVPVTVSGNTSGPVHFDLQAQGCEYISLPVCTTVQTEVCVYVPIISTEDVCTGFVTNKAGCAAIGAPDCKAFGIGREGGYLSLAFTDNVIYNGDGYDVRIFEQDEGDATEILSGLITLNRFFDVATAETKSWMPVDRNIQIPTDQLAPELTAPLGFIVSRDGDSYECGYIIDVDLGVLADRLEKQLGEGAVPRTEAINLLTFISQGEGNTTTGNFKDLFAGADIDSVKGLHNRFGLRVCPTNCSESGSFRDLPVGCLFLNERDQQEESYRNCRSLWKYKLCGDVYCDGFVNNSSRTNSVCVESYLRPYHIRHHLKCNGLSALAQAASDAGLPFGLDN